MTHGIMSIQNLLNFHPAILKLFGMAVRILVLVRGGNHLIS
jgi:hypothetical protein